MDLPFPPISALYKHTCPHTHAYTDLTLCRKELVIQISDFIKIELCHPLSPKSTAWSNHTDGRMDLRSVGTEPAAWSDQRETLIKARREERMHFWSIGMAPAACSAHSGYHPACVWKQAARQNVCVCGLLLWEKHSGVKFPLRTVLESSSILPILILPLVGKMLNCPRISV